MNDSKETRARSGSSAAVLDPFAGAGIQAVVSQYLCSCILHRLSNSGLAILLSVFPRNIIRPSNESTAGTIHLQEKGRPEIAALFHPGVG